MRWRSSTNSEVQVDSRLRRSRSRNREVSNQRCRSRLTQEGRSFVGEVGEWATESRCRCRCSSLGTEWKGPGTPYSVVGCRNRLETWQLWCVLRKVGSECGSAFGADLERICWMEIGLLKLGLRVGHGCSEADGDVLEVKSVASGV